MSFSKISCTKDEVQLSCDLDNILLALGFRLSFSGTKYIKDVIIFALDQDEDLNLKRISTYLSKTYQVKSTRIISEIKYSINNLDLNSFKSNFRFIFGLDYIPSILSSKEIIYLLYNKLLRQKK